MISTMSEYVASINAVGNFDLSPQRRARANKDLEELWTKDRAQFYLYRSQMNKLYKQQEERRKAKARARAEQQKRGC